MTTFKNIHFTVIYGDCTTIAFCQAVTAPSSDWVKCDASENNANHLYTQGGVRYFGWL